MPPKKSFVQRLCEEDTPEQLVLKRKKARSRVACIIGLCVILKLAPALIDSVESNWPYSR